MLTISSIKTEQIKNLQNASINRSSSMLKLQICTFHLFTQRQVFPRDTIDGISTVKHASWLSLSTSHSSTNKKSEKSQPIDRRARECSTKNQRVSLYAKLLWEGYTHKMLFLHNSHCCMNDFDAWYKRKSASELFISLLSNIFHLKALISFVLW